MKGFFSKLKKNKKGYTLTELIVVVAILGILAAIATPMIMNAVGDAKESGTAASITSIETAVQLCLADGSLVMSSTTPKVISLPSSTSFASIGDAVQEKLIGHEYPINEALSASETNKRQWFLNLNTGRVSSKASTDFSCTLA